MIFELPYCFNINDIMKQCNILKINQLYKLETASLMFKLIQSGNKSPAFSCNLHLNPCKYNTRNNPINTSTWLQRCDHETFSWNPR